MLGESSGILLGGIVLAFLFFSKFGSGNSGTPTGYELVFKIPLTNHLLHIHHWLWATLVLSIWLAISRTITQTFAVFTVGFLVGTAIHGLGYNDWYQIIYQHRIDNEATLLETYNYG